MPGGAKQKVQVSIRVWISEGHDVVVSIPIAQKPLLSAPDLRMRLREAVIARFPGQPVGHLLARVDAMPFQIIEDEFEGQQYGLVLRHIAEAAV